MFPMSTRIALVNNDKIVVRTDLPGLCTVPKVHAALKLIYMHLQESSSLKDVPASAQLTLMNRTMMSCFP